MGSHPSFCRQCDSSNLCGPWPPVYCDCGRRQRYEPQRLDGRCLCSVCSSAVPSELLTLKKTRSTCSYKSRSCARQMDPFEVMVIGVITVEKSQSGELARNVGDNVLHRNLFNIAHHVPEEDFRIHRPRTARWRFGTN